MLAIGIGFVFMETNENVRPATTTQLKRQTPSTLMRPLDQIRSGYFEKQGKTTKNKQLLDL